MPTIAIKRKTTTRMEKNTIKISEIKKEK